jgi:bacillithiol biosynthesis cysteine-adding enzyme BshC
MFAAEHITYQQTNSFSKIVSDYLDDHSALHPFRSFPPSLEGIKDALEARKNTETDRHTLVNHLQKQYGTMETTEAVRKNISALGENNSFTITTAHQPNLFSGPLYFLYKILHAIRLADYLNEQFPQEHFVPVYYMGSEDADFAELNHFSVRGKKYEWKTGQTGAVGRMLIDQDLLRIVQELRNQAGVEPFGDEACTILSECYTKGKTVQQATFELVNRLFSSYGLLVLIADDEALKRQMIPVFKDDIFRQTPSSLVENTSKKLAEQYNVQAHPREINLFYLKGDIRQRIVRMGEKFCVHHTDIIFTGDELREELNRHPERFSPNVILRGLFQETILPNIAFIGGGGELAYWLQLKDLFEHYHIPFPVLMLRNSFLIIEEHHQRLAEKLGLETADLFRDSLSLIDKLIEREGLKPKLNGELDELKHIYDHLKDRATSVDPTLQKHVEALKVKTVGLLLTLEKKMIRAERRKHEDMQRQIAKLKEQLFPRNGLQERVENFSGYYARWGSGFIHQLYLASPGLEQKFTVVRES